MSVTGKPSSAAQPAGSPIPILRAAGPERTTLRRRVHIQTTAPLCPYALHYGAAWNCQRPHNCGVSSASLGTSETIPVALLHQ